MFREIESSSQREDAGLGTHPTKISSHGADRLRFPGHLGRVFYRQQRGGKQGRLLWIFKFRSMQLNVASRAHGNMSLD
jgi:hypothetical protein